MVCIRNSERTAAGDVVQTENPFRPTVHMVSFTTLLMPERHCVSYPSTLRVRFCRQCPDILCRILQYCKGALDQYTYKNVSDVLPVEATYGTTQG